MRLLFSCSELGLGHVSRIIPLGKRLEQNGHEAFFFSGGKAYELLKKEFRHVYKCTPIAWYENASGIVTSASLINILFPLPVFNADNRQFEIKNSNAMEVIHRYYDLRENLRDIAPDVLIADGDINALRLAHRWKIPAVYIANLIRPSYGFNRFLNPGERIVEEYVKKCQKIVIPDNPPPFTISDYNIGNLDNSEFKNKTEYVGAFIDTTPVKGAEEHIFAPVSGPIGTRSKLIKTLLPVIQKTQNKAIISLGIPGQQASAKIGNCELHNWLSAAERQEAMKNAKYVIFSGGHITCFETVKYAKPSICIPTQPEQGGNAAKLADLGCSIKVKNQKELAKAVQKMESEYYTFKKNILALNAFSARFRGLDRAVEIVENAAD
jgi:UDP-N-acetylglucosamine--N-acetylmuramyl-(pentapeptide) pyrophosphoryl-undecaprenol N-acetylglucosamine transferase